MSDNVMIEAIGLHKSYASGFEAIKDVSFHCRQGEIVGFLGPNGAGKTTTMRILTGFMPATAGTAKVAGYDVSTHSLEARQRLGYLPETVPLYPEMAVEDYLAFVGKIRRLDDLWDRIDDALESVGMLNRAESLIGSLSKGMRQRVGLAQALLHDPDVLILDEPTIGLDPAQIREVRNLITELGKRHTILLSTHILSEVEQICNRVIMIINGQLYADIPLNQQGNTVDSMIVKLTVGKEDAGILTELSALPNVNHIHQENETGYSLTITQPDETRQNIAATVVENGWGLIGLATDSANLESLFMEKLREAESAEEIHQFTEEEE